MLWCFEQKQKMYQKNSKLEKNTEKVPERKTNLQAKGQK